MSMPASSISGAWRWWRRASNRWWILFLLLFSVRFFLLLAALDPEEERIGNFVDCAGLEWKNGPSRPLYDREELYAGACAQAILRGAGLPWSSYRFMPYGSGSLVLSVAAVPWVAVAGTSYLAWKILPLLLSVAGGLVWVALVRRWWGTTAAAWMALLYLFAPPVLVRTLLIAKGDHAEAAVLVGCVLLVACRAVDSDGRRRLFGAGLAGLLAGVSIFITYSAAPILAGVALVWGLSVRLRPARLWIAAGAGLLLGLVPWVWTLAATGGGAVNVYGRFLGAPVDPVAIGQRLGVLAGQGLLAAFEVPGGALVRALAGLFWFVLVIAGFVGLLRRARSLPPRLAATGLVAHVAAFCVLAPDASSRYLIPAYPLFLLAVATLAASGRDQHDSRGDRRHPENGASQTPPRRAPGHRRLSKTAAALAVVLGVTSWLSSVARPHAPDLPSLAGADWDLWGEVVGTKLTHGQIGQVPREMRGYLWVGYGKRVFYQRAESWSDLAAVAGEESPRVWRGIGISAMERGRPQDAASHLERLVQTERTALAGGLAAYGEALFAPLLREGGFAYAQSLVRELTPADQAPLRRVLARCAGVLAAQGLVPSVAGPQPPVGMSEPEAGYAAGWALPSSRLGIAPAPGTEASSWPSRLADLPSADPHRAAGAADALLWHLARRMRESSLDGEGEPRRLLEALGTAVRELPESQAAAIFERAGETCGGAPPARAARVPGPPETAHGAAPGRSGWREVVPERYHAAFLRGLSVSGH